MKRDLRLVWLVMIVALLATALLAGCETAAEEQTAAADTATTEDTAATEDAEEDEAAEDTSSEDADTTDDPLADLEPIVIKLAHATSLEDLSTIYTEKWMDAVTEKSGGKITFDYYPAGQMGSYAELTEALSLGALDMAKVDPTLMTSYVPYSGLLNLPFIVKDFDHMDRVLDSELGTYIVDTLEADHSMKILGFYWCGFRCICSKREITNVEDCKGLVIGSPESDVYINTFKQLGMKPTPIPFTERYLAMESGVTEAAEPVPSVIHDSKFYKIGKYVLRSNHMISLNCLTVNTDFWASLPKEYQDIMVECAGSNTRDQKDAMIAKEDEYYELMEADGAVINTWDDYNELVELFKPYWADVAEDVGGDASDYVDLMIELGK